MRSLLVALLLLAAATAAPAHADDGDPDALLDEGRRLFTDEDDFDGARELFNRSYQARPSWQALNGIALTWQKQARWVRALETYERLRAEFGPELAAKQLETVDRRIVDLTRRVAVLTLDVPAAGAAISVDGEPVGQGPFHGNVRLDPGGHLVAASLADHRPYTERISLAAGQTTTLTVSLVPIDVKVVVVPPKPVATRRRFATWIPWAALTSGAGLLVVGALSDLAAERDFDRFDDMVAAAGGDMPAPTTVDDASLRSGERKRTAATVLYVAGGLAVTGGAVLLLLNRPRPVESQPLADVVVGPGSAQVQVSVRF
jgi:hypothetical protein